MIERSNPRTCAIAQKPLVTDHAIVRWLQRVQRIGDVLDRAFPAGAPDRVLAEHGCRTLGISLAEAREAICPRRLRAGIAMGAHVVRGADRTLIVRGGRVVTTLAREQKSDSHSRAEASG